MQCYHENKTPVDRTKQLIPPKVELLDLEDS